MEKVMKMLGVVTLYNPDKEQALNNINCYEPYIDKLIVWDNSAECHSKWFASDRTIYHWTGKNTFIAPALNYALQHAKENAFDNVLIMDEDSKWNNFLGFRNTVEQMQREGKICIYTPYVVGCDVFAITDAIQEKRIFINSGTIIPVKILEELGGVDEKAFPLDAIDHDLAFSNIEKGHKTVCLTEYKLHHSLGKPKRLGLFRIFTPDYNSLRTYHMTRSHIICYRKHRALMTADDTDYLLKEILLRKLGRIILAEPDKLCRLISFIKGLVQGVCYKL